MEQRQFTVAVLGLGYVGLPVAMARSKCFRTVDFHIFRDRVNELAASKDRTNQISFNELKACSVEFTSSAGYGPERINPGDKEHTFTKIRKVVAARYNEALEKVAYVYGQVVEAGIYKAESIRVAEAAKVIENTQRDLNIALMNELSILFDRMGIDTQAVLAAASTKWNFLRFVPGLVGGHCIGVDPYYLTYKAETLGYHPQVILAGRRINDGMGKFIALKTIKAMVRAGKQIEGALVTILGLTYKENCPDVRNSRVIDVVREFKEWGMHVQVSDPTASPDDARKEIGLELIPLAKLKPSSAVVIAVGHDEYRSLSAKDFSSLCESKPVVMDVKAILPPHAASELDAIVVRL